jgi:very-short-patch-repair endonuclease
MVAKGELRRLHRGYVYCLGSAHLELDAEIIAVCLAVPSGWISGVTAANYWRMRGVPRGRIEVTVPGTKRPRLTLARVRRTNLREPEIVETLLGGRVSSPAQTLFEISYELDDRALRNAFEYSLEVGLVTHDDIDRTAAKAIAMGRNGSTRFRRVICDRPSDLPPVMSHDELILIEALASVGIQVERQFPLLMPGGSTIYLDAAIPDIRLGLEIDGPTHDTVTGVHRDKHRDLLLAAEGWQVLRPTTDDVRHRLRATVSIIEAVIRNRRRDLVG